LAERTEKTPVDVEIAGSAPSIGRERRLKAVNVKENAAMKYMLLMAGTKADFEWYANWPKKDLEAHFAFMHDFNRELKESGKLVATEGLAFPDQAVIVRAGPDGAPITDGVFPESKEFLAGYWIVDVENADEAHRIAARASAGPGCKERGAQPIEVRRVMSGPPDDIL
jgi:hypothetical protein